MADLSWKKVKFSSEEKALERIQSNKQTKEHFGLYHMIKKKKKKKSNELHASLSFPKKKKKHWIYISEPDCLITMPTVLW